MLNEIYVTLTNDEQRMTLFEGQTVSRALDVRATEMAIIDVSDPEFDEIVVVPGSMLRSGEKISDEELPFDVRCVKYIPNSDVRTRTRSSGTPVASIASELDSDARAWVERTLADFSVEQLAAQLIIEWIPGGYVAPTSPAFEPLRKWVEDDGIGGVSPSIGSPSQATSPIRLSFTRTTVR